MTTSSRRLEIAEEAERDIRGIFRFTHRAWGDRQQRAYARKITDSLKQLIRYPGLGQSVDEISPGLRALRVEQHVVYYRVTDQAIRVLRIIHVRMDAAAQFE